MGAGRNCCKVFTVSLVPATVLCLAIAFFAGFILLPILYTELSYKEQYAMIVDAGSSHSEVYLYNWKLPFYDGTGLVSQDSYCKPEGGGISSYTDPAEAAESLRNCLSGLLKEVPKKYYAHSYKVKTWLGATAGMRLLKHENKTLADDIIDGIKEKPEDNIHMNAKILSGQEEALGGWITANYVNGTFKKTYPVNKKRDSSTSTKGALDMGGASMQISYGTKVPSNHTKSVTLFDQSYDVYARSYLCYGVNEELRRILAYAVKDGSYNVTVVNPCFHKGYLFQTNSSYLFDGHYCTMELGPPDNGFKKFNITGSSSPSECVTLIGKAMNFSVNISSGGNMEYTPPAPNGEFYGFSNFYHAADTFNMYLLNSNLLKSFEDNVTDRCQKSWEEINNDDKSIYKAFKCMDALFVLHVLDGMGFTDNNTEWSIKFVSQVSGLDIGWALGYMLDKSRDFVSLHHFTHYPYKMVDLIVGMIVLLILCLIFAIFFAFTCSACTKSLNPSKSGYTNIT